MLGIRYVSDVGYCDYSFCSPRRDDMDMHMHISTISVHRCRRHTFRRGVINMVNEDTWDSEILQPSLPEYKKGSNHINHTPVPLTAPFENGGHSCGNCKKLLSHFDMLGTWDASNTSFTVVGYHCQKCEKRYLFPKYVKWENQHGSKYHTMSGWEREFYRGSGKVFGVSSGAP